MDIRKQIETHANLLSYEDLDFYEIDESIFDGIVERMEQLERENAEFRNCLSETQIWAIEQKVKKECSKT